MKRYYVVVVGNEGSMHLTTKTFDEGYDTLFAARAALAQEYDDGRYMILHSTTDSVITKSSETKTSVTLDYEPRKRRPKKVAE